MRIITSTEELRNFRQALSTTQSVGFVPTMGNLHQGHLSLVEQSKSNNNITIVSIFVNPTQFNNPEDLEKYPRTLDEDRLLLEQAQVDVLFLPEYASLYADNYRYSVQENDYSLTLEGEHRPGHFTGVLTIVMKLLNLVQAHNAYFGEKDFQQYKLIKDMASAFFLPTQIHMEKTIRETSGLAMSSRNNRLSEDERKKADNFAAIFHQPHLSTDEIIVSLTEQGYQIDYIKECTGRRFAAVYVGPVRLIDNYHLK
jgi:pantoate--beta-alanine ligase